MIEKNKTSVGVCLGASRITAVKLKSNGSGEVERSEFSRYHGGRVKDTLSQILNDNGLDSTNTAVTGRKFKSLVTLPKISEPEAVELAYGALRDDHDEHQAVVSAGGETFMVYKLNKEGKITAVYTGGKCASGTGEFFKQQVKRIGMDLDEIPDLKNVEDPYRLSGRCSVFCKSDCTHALNKGEKKEKVLAGLSKMMADKIIELLGKAEASEIMLVGGTARNKNMVRFLKKRLKRVTVPREFEYFEALGTAIWAADNNIGHSGEKIFKKNKNSFETLPPLSDSAGNVTFHPAREDRAQKQDSCILGVDVGSTTTKAVLIRQEDAACLGKVYLRTDGNPVKAARKCYSVLNDKTSGKDIAITGHAVTGSGRQIVALHGKSDCVVNEIIAHAEAALYFDSDVDTVFEIGGQDAKYTRITSGVPSDYAMNEACSAGTGSFLEEAAKESLGIRTTDIAQNAMNGKNPVNFNDQCAAFIGSDIKNAIQEGVSKEDISAGLVYSICMNYSNRVKGSRPDGEKIFMQGGVCYNRAVPTAMASLTGKDIIVPPDPGLMGAFGVALIARKKIIKGKMKEKDISLQNLSGREIKYRKPFICRGGKQDCDRKCSISVVEIEGDKFPFGGVCNRFDNLLKDESFNAKELDLASAREKLLYEENFGKKNTEKPARGRIGINRSLNNIILMPLFTKFFGELGFDVILPEDPDPKGTEKQSAAFCYPVELSHKYIYSLIREDIDYIYLPHVKSLHVAGGLDRNVSCVLAQGEPYCLKAAFSELRSDKVLSPVLNFTNGLHEAEKEFIKTGKKLGASRKEAKQAYAAAIKNQEDFNRKVKEMGSGVLRELQENPDSRALVIFGRPYNAFSSDANMAITRKLATRGEKVITIDMLPLEDTPAPSSMYWATGQVIMKAAQLVAQNSQLFGVYITNFSCGPDSFLTGYFRRKMKSKPSLILELDSHSADAGIDTRVDAFLDIINGYSEIQESSNNEKKKSDKYRPAKINYKKSEITVTDSSGKNRQLFDKNVRILVPSMGRLVTKGFVNALKYCGLNASAAPEPGENELRRAKSFSTCKECLPLQLTLGTLLNYVSNGRDKEEVLIYFMPESDGPCRFGQYSVLMENLIKEMKIENVALLSPTSTNSYAGISPRFARKAWQAFVTADTLDCIYNSLLALAEDKETALKKFSQEEEKIFTAIRKLPWNDFKKVLAASALEFSKIPLKTNYEDAPKALLAGEIYVRNDAFSRRNLIEKLAERGIVTRISPAYEWLYYTDYCVQNNLDIQKPTTKEKLSNRIEGIYRKHIEKQVKKALSDSGLCDHTPVDVAKYIKASENSISPYLTGEAGLTVGSAYAEIIDEVSGVISVGPFGCMPGRLSESIISERLSEEKRNLLGKNGFAESILEKFPELPYLALETDGNAFPQVTQARIEAFCLQVERMNKHLKKVLT